LGTSIGEIFKGNEDFLGHQLGLADGIVRSILGWEGLLDLQRELAEMEKWGAVFLPVFSDDYPKLLKEIDDAPIGIYAMGDPTFFQDAIAIVGTRNCTLYGEKIAYELGRDLVERNCTVVSGLAKGIDMAAHGGALAGHGKTVAVLAGGLDKVYPAENRDLYEKIRCEGTLVSEFPFSRHVDRQSFAIRNRIITGLARATVVVESPIRGGSMLSAGFARQQGRPLFAVPGRVGDLCSEGCLQLIRDGAGIWTHVDDLFFGKEGRNSVPERKLPPVQGTIWEVEPENLEEDDRKIFQLLQHGEPQTVEEVAAALHLSPLECGNKMQLLQIRGILQRKISGEFFLKK
jgi:DNA processing protein